ncbi:MAG: caspase family protein [Bacteroidales bacterium]|nr:caspase family protein [Bacteroidales bacterium]
MKKLLFILLLVTPLCLYGKIFAVFVGVSEYDQPVGNLTYCHRDAIAMYELMKGHTTPECMVLLTDEQARHDSVVHHTRRLFREAQRDDIVLFFFSGHGNDNLFCLYDRNLRFSTLQQIFKECKANRKLIFADACHSGTLRQEGSSNHSMTESNVLLFLSSRSDQQSQEDSWLRNGVFTFFLLAGLRGGADTNKDGYITAIELFSFVNPRVKQRSGGSQVPVMWGRFNKNMIILKL